MKLLQELRHENIIRYHDSFFEEGVLFIVFEWAAGGDLKKVVREAVKPLDESVIWSYFTQISEGLRHMHDLRMVCCAVLVNVMGSVSLTPRMRSARADAS